MNEDVKSENLRIHSRADELIACLEVEIAKRDARIMELERYRFAFNEWHDKTEWVQAESATLSAKYLGCHRADVMRSLIDDLREELAACRVAVENCEVFRARIAELEARIVWLECEAQVNAAPVSEAKAQVYEPLVCDYCNAETQDPWHGSGMLNGVESRHIHACNQCRNLLPTGKAQGVVMLSRDAIREVFMRNGFTVKEGQADLKPYVYAAAEELLRLSAPVQQVSVPDDEAVMAKARELFGWAYGLGGFSDAVRDLVAFAHPAAPAADAGIVDMYRHLQKVTPYRFKKIQDASITDGGDVMYFHKDRFDAALLADMADHRAAKGVV